MSPGPRVVLADDHTLVAEGIRSLLDGVFEIVGAVADGEALLAVVATTRPDVIVTDLTMPRMNGLDAIRELRRRGNGVGIVVLTMHADPFLAAEAIRAGASGYVLKHSAGEELVQAIREVNAGHMYITPLIARDLIKRLISKPAGADAEPETMLTPRQRQILQLTAEGRSMKQVAGMLNISRRTAESHKYQLMQTLGVHSTAELVQFAIRLGLIEVTAPKPTP